MPEGSTGTGGVARPRFVLAGQEIPPQPGPSEEEDDAER